MNEHPLNKFWREDSGWRGPLNPTPETGLSEGTLCIETWNAAISAAVDWIRDHADPEDTHVAEWVRKLEYTEADREEV